MRILLYLGKGGVGKTTTAAATALRCAQMGFRTLVVSTDIAHSLADSLDRPLQSVPTEITANLFAQEINVLDEVRKNWGTLQGYMGKILRKQGMNKTVAEEMAIIPGMEEIFSLLHIYRHAASREFDRVIVDAAPTGETMRLLAMPESFQWYVERFFGWGETAMRLTGGLLGRLMPEQDVLAGLPKLVDDVKALQQILSDPQTTSYRVVINPEKMVIKEAARAVTYLSLFECPVDAVVVNRILPGVRMGGVDTSREGGETVLQADKAALLAPSSDPYLRQLQEHQARYLVEIERDFYPLPILYSSWRSEEVVGIAPLRSLADEMYGQRDPGEVMFVGQVQEIEEQGEDLVLKLPIPHIELEKIRLTKRGDELFITIGNFKREYQLPAALAQRDASGAVFAGGILRIRFPAKQPDSSAQTA
jgi:arsenite-transporting ATPase